MGRKKKKGGAGPVPIQNLVEHFRHLFAAEAADASGASAPLDAPIDAALDAAQLELLAGAAPTAPTAPATSHSTSQRAPRVTSTPDMSSHMGRGSNYPGSSSYPGYQNGTSAYGSKPAGRIMVVCKDGTMNGPWVVSSSDYDFWDLLVLAYPAADGTCYIPEDHCDFEYKLPSFNACTFRACEDYLQARWGRKLHTTDQDWLAQHPLATDQGLPTAATPICLQGMLEPYGMGVSRVRVRKGLLLIGDELTKFAFALGCNPIGLQDNQTDNVQFSALTGGQVSPEEADRQFRFEFSDHALPGSIVGEIGWTSGGGVQAGALGGHARYLAPRAQPGNWQISIQLAPLEQIRYMVPIALPEYTPRRGDGTLLLGSITKLDGSLVAVKHQGWYYTPDEAADRKANPGKYTSSRPTTTSATPTSTGPDSGSSGSSAGTQGTLGSPITSKSDRTPEADTYRVHVTYIRDGQQVRVIETRDRLDGRLLSAERLNTELDAYGSPVTPASTTPGTTPKTTQTTLAVQRCAVCQAPTGRRELVDGTTVCIGCWETAWIGYSCPTDGCHTRFGPGHTPRLLYRNSHAGKTYVECPRKGCDTRIQIDEQLHAVDYPDLVAVARGCRDETMASVTPAVPALEAPEAPEAPETPGTPRTPGTSAESATTTSLGLPGEQAVSILLRQKWQHLSVEEKRNITDAVNCPMIELLEEYVALPVAQQATYAKTFQVPAVVDLLAQVTLSLSARQLTRDAGDAPTLH
jgi:hypothetical protein